MYRNKYIKMRRRKKKRAAARETYISRERREK
jgi:hypothetical protein